MEKSETAAGGRAPAMYRSSVSERKRVGVISLQDRTMRCFVVARAVGKHVKPKRDRRSAVLCHSKICCAIVKYVEQKTPKIGGE